LSTGLALVAFLVNDYDEAIAFFTQALGFTLVEDTPREPGKRWVVVRPAGSDGAALLLARAATPAQREHVGHQGGGRVFLFLRTSRFDADRARMREHGVRFAEEPRLEPYGRVVVFLDLYGNRWDLLEATPAAPTRATSGSPP